MILAAWHFLKKRLQTKILAKFWRTISKKIKSKILSKDYNIVDDNVMVRQCFLWFYVKLVDMAYDSVFLLIVIITHFAGKGISIQVLECLDGVNIIL